jgi:hypothetical protein
LTISGLHCSLAFRLFFIAQSKPMQKPSDGGAMDVDAALGEFDTQFVQGRFAMGGDTLQHPCTVRRKLCPTKRMALLGRSKRSAGPVKDHHVVDEMGRNAEMPSRLPVTISLINKRNDTLTQLDRMRLAHGVSPSMGTVNHKSPKTGIPESC